MSVRLRVKRSDFDEHSYSKRSITSLSLFNNSKKEDDQQNSNNNSQKERKNSFGKLRARSSLDLSSLGFGSVSRASSRAALTDLKEENHDAINNTNKEKTSKCLFPTK